MLRAIPAILIVLAALGISAMLLRTPPQVPRSSRPEAVPVVSVASLDPADQPVFVEAFGTVVAARDVPVQSEVAGRVIDVHPNLQAGGLVREGEVLLKVDPADYELAVREAEAEARVARFEIERLKAGVDVLRNRAAQVEADLDYTKWNVSRLGRLSEGDQAGQVEVRDAESRLAGLRATYKALEAQIAEQERSVDSAVARADVAESRLDAARLNLERTTVRASFDAIVLDETVEPGQLIAPQNTVATLAATDRFWVEASVPVARLRDIVRQEGAAGTRAQLDGSQPVDVYLSTGESDFRRDGMLLRALGQLDRAGRMARVLVAVDNPLDLDDGGRRGDRAILIGSYVRLRIGAGHLRSVVSIPRKALRENERVWVRDARGRLAIRPVEILWRRDEDVLVRPAFEPGDELVTSHLASVVPGTWLDVPGREEIPPGTTADAGTAGSSDNDVAPSAPSPSAPSPSAPSPSPPSPSAVKAAVQEKSAQQKPANKKPVPNSDLPAGAAP